MTRTCVFLLACESFLLLGRMLPTNKIGTTRERISYYLSLHLLQVTKNETDLPLLSSLFFLLIYLDQWLRSFHFFNYLIVYYIYFHLDVGPTTGWCLWFDADNHQSCCSLVDYELYGWMIGFVVLWPTHHILSICLKWWEVGLTWYCTYHSLDIVHPPHLFCFQKLNLKFTEVANSVQP